MIKVILLLTVLILSVGCQASRSMKQFYYQYLDPPPEISLRSKGISAGEAQLAEVAIPIDEKIQAISRFLAVNDKISYEEWLRALAMKFPWVQGAGIISKDGAVFYAQPEGLFSSVNFTPLLDVKTTGIKLQQKAMFVPVSKNDAFIFLGQPVFDGEELQEYRLVAFSLSTLANFASDSSRLSFIGNDTVLWKGTDISETSPIMTANWNKISNKTVSGVLKGKEYRTEYAIVYLGPVSMCIAVDFLPKPKKTLK